FSRSPGDPPAASVRTAAVRGDSFTWGVPISSLVGRMYELLDIERLVGDHRLVTLVGPPGVGKTRLAIELARRRAEPVLACGRAQASQPLDLDRSLSNALGAPLCERERPGREILGAALAARGSVLVVLDNADDLIDTAADVLVPLLAVAPLARVLVTSR